VCWGMMILNDYGPLKNDEFQFSHRGNFSFFGFHFKVIGMGGNFEKVL
jgi:hypothetical protein